MPPDAYPTPTASIGTMAHRRVTIGRKKNGTLRKINASGKMWSPNLEMAVFFSPEIMERMEAETQEPETEEQKRLFAELIRLDIGKCRLNPEWVEWIMGFPCGWTDAGCGAGSPQESEG